MSKASEFAITLAANQQKAAALLRTVPRPVFPVGHEIDAEAAVSDSGDLLMLVKTMNRVRAAEFGRWLVETFEDLKA